MPKRFLCVAVVLAFVFAASMAYAYPTVYLYEAGVANNHNTTIWAGSYGKVSGVQTGNYLLDIQYPIGNTAVQYSGYCVEPEESAKSYQTYELVPIADMGSIISGSNVVPAFEAAAWILSQNYTGADAASAQAAVWELTWDYSQGNSYSLTTGNFQYFSGLTSAQVTNIATFYNAALAAVAGGYNPGSDYLVAVNPVGEQGWSLYQDYIIPNPVPLPGAMLLLGVGMLRLATYARRKRSLV